MRRRRRRLRHAIRSQTWPRPTRNRRRARANLTRRSCERSPTRFVTGCSACSTAAPRAPNQLARELDLPLGRVSYHIRLLSDLGAIELVRTEPRRGALEHFYRAVTTVWFSEADWQKLPRSARRGILGQNLQQIFTERHRGRRRRRLRPPVQRRPARAARARRGRAWTSSPGCCATSLDRAREINLRAAERRERQRRDRRPTELAILLFERRA